jgi:hypothetical protein
VHVRSYSPIRSHSPVNSMDSSADVQHHVAVVQRVVRVAPHGEGRATTGGQLPRMTRPVAAVSSPPPMQPAPLPPAVPPAEPATGPAPTPAPAPAVVPLGTAFTSPYYFPRDVGAPPAAGSAAGMGDDDPESSQPVMPSAARSALPLPRHRPAPVPQDRAKRRLQRKAELARISRQKKKAYQQARVAAERAVLRRTLCPARRIWRTAWPASRTA